VPKRWCKKWAKIARRPLHDDVRAIEDLGSAGATADELAALDDYVPRRPGGRTGGQERQRQAQHRVSLRRPTWALRE